MNKILDSNNLIRDDVKCPTIEDLIKAKEIICAILSDMSYQIKKSLESKELTNYGKFNSVSCNSVFENLNAIVRLGSNYLNQIFTLSRNFYELIIDNFWLYHFYRGNPEVAEDIAGRFFVFHNIINMQNLKDTISIHSVDIFFRTLSKKDLVSKTKEHGKYIKNYQYWGEKKFQKRNWRAHPKYFEHLDEVKWGKRSEIAKDVAKELVNFKNAPFLENLSSLSAYNHWDPIQSNILSDVDNNLFYARTLNLLLCLSLDFLNLQYQIQEIESKRPLTFGKAANLIFYSST